MRFGAARAAAALGAVALALLAAAPAQAAPGDVTLVANPDADGLDGVDADGLIPSVSAGGRFVAFVEDDAAFGTSIFLRNMASPVPIPVAAPSAHDEELSYDADSPGLSADGRILVFASEDPALSTEDEDTARGPLGEPSFSQIRDIFVYDRMTGKIQLASRRSGTTGAAADDDSNLPSISSDGRYVAFGTESRNLTPGRHFDGGVYVRDLKTNSTVLASRAAGAGGKPLRAFEPSLSTGARMVAFTWRPRRMPLEISVRDRARRTTPLASRANGARGRIANRDCGEPAISADGRFVAFASKATNLVRADDDRVEDVFVRDLRRHRTILVSRAAGRRGAAGSGDSSRPAISADGHYVAFESFASNLGPHDNAAVPDVFVKDLRTGRVVLASAGRSGPADRPSASPSISPDGRFVVFNSKATNLNPSDTDRRIGVFRYQLR
jgi:Tol biopolymer transport system component